MNHFLEVMSKYLNRAEVRTLIGPLKKAHFLLLLIYSQALGCHKSKYNSVERHLADIRPSIFLQNVLINSEILDSKVAKKPHTSMVSPPQFMI